MDDHKKVPERVNEEVNSSFLSKLLFLYLLPFIRTGYKRALKRSDFWSLEKCDESANLTNVFETNWEEEVKNTKEKVKTKPDLHKVICRTFARSYWFLSIFVFCQEILQCTQLFFMSRLIKYFQYCSDIDAQHAYYYAAWFSLSSFLLVVVRHRPLHLLTRIVMHWRIACSALIYKKAILFLPYLWVTPFSIVMYGIFIWFEMSPTYLAGFLSILIINPLQVYLSRKAGTLRPRINIHTDKRISLINDLLNGIRVIKMYTWEKPFADLIDGVRKLEIKRYRVVAVFDSLVYGLFFANTKIFVLVAILFNFYIDSAANRMKSDHIFVATAMYNILRSSVGLFLPNAIKFYAEYKVSVRRIRLNAIENMSFRLKSGELLMIVGPVGSGKSTLLQCLCGDDCVRISGTMTINGQTVYLPQKSWVFQGTIRQNVVFAKSDQPFDAEAYSKALEVCSLDKDIENFPKKDKTLVGDRGVSLSGGQKARIALARAVYFNADIYLLDDPLATVDATVGRFIFEKCINGHLKRKTRILVINQLQYLRYADQIIIMKDGKMEACGSYEDLVATGERFTSIVGETSLKNKNRDSQNENVDEKLVADENRPTKSANDEDWVACKVQNHSKLKVTDIHKLFTSGSIITVEVTRILRALKEPSREIPTNRVQQAKDIGHEESVAQGHIKWDVVTAYFGSMGNCVTVLSLFIFFFVGQALFNFNDYWLNLWTNTEDQARLNVYIRRSMDQNDTINPCLLLRHNMKQIYWKNYSIFKINYINGTSIDNYLAYDSTFYMMIFVASLVLVIITSVIRSIALKILLTRSSLKLHTKMLHSVINTSAWFFDQNPVGRILNRFSKDIGSMDEQLSYVTLDLLFGLLAFFGVLITIVFLNPWIMLLITPILILFLLLRHCYICSSRSTKRLEAAAKSAVYGHVCTSINGLSCIRTMGAQEAVIEDFHRFQNFHTSIYYASISVSRWFGFNIDCLTVLLITVVTFLNVASSQSNSVGKCLSCGNAHTFRIIGQNTGTVGLSLFYAMSLLTFLQWTVRQTTEFENLLVAVERILEYGTLPHEVQNIDPLNVLPSDWPSFGEIVFENVKLKYDKNTSGYVLKGLSFRVSGGEKIGIVGRTGAGKSSIINALFGLSTFEGSILIDGVNINSINLQELRRHISIIPQDPTLFAGTLRKNLDPFEKYEDNEIWLALDQVELKKSFHNQSGLHLLIREGGTNLSVGQRQLVCLARALLRKNKILIVDEATSNIDLHTDELIQRTIRLRFSDCTVLTIAHRISTLLDYSQIIVLDDGRILEMAPPSVLLEDPKSIFRALYLQSTKDIER